MRILLFYPGTIEKSGGMQHICAQFSNAMSSRGHQVAIAWYGRKQAQCFYPLSPDVEIYSLKPVGKESESKYHDVGHDVSLANKIIREVLKVFSRRAYRRWNDKSKKKILAEGIKRTISDFRPDVIISFSKDMTFYLVGNTGIIPIVTMMHIDPNHIFFDSYMDEIEALNRSNAIQVLAPSFVSEVREYCPDAKIVYIPNPISQAEKVAYLAGRKDKYRIIDMARINEQKRQDVLIKAFSKVADEFPDWILELWGDDKTYPRYVSKLNNLIHENHMAHRILIKGVTQNPARVYIAADIFAFPSAYEGFGLALMEAMSAGLPAVGFKSCPAVNEMIHNGVDGFLADDSVDSFAEKLKQLMSSKELRIKMGRNAHETAKLYAPDKVWKQWETLMHEVIEGEKQ